MSILEIQRQMAQEECNLIIKQYVAVSEQLRGMIDEALKVTLEFKRQQLAQQAREKEAYLADLKAQLASPPTSDVEKKAKSAGDFPAGQSRRAILIGIDNYDDYPPLNVCAKDAAAIRIALCQGGYENDHVRIMTDQSAKTLGRDMIVDTLKDAAGEAKTDLLLFYFSGHGDSENGESFLVMPGTKATAPAESGIPLSAISQILQGSTARSKVIIIDACHAGADFSAKGKSQPSTPLKYIRHLYHEAKGWVVIASCEQDQLSYVWIEQERSVFTHFFLEALSGEADFQNLGFVSALNAYSYIQPRVKEWTELKKYPPQTPTMSAVTAGDIALANYKQ